MAISNQAAIRKMIDELQQALNDSQTDDRSREHIRAVRLLCDLILEEGTSKSAVSASHTQASSQQELQKMIGGFETSLSQAPESSEASGGREKDNEDSIFDF